MRPDPPRAESVADHRPIARADSAAGGRDSPVARRSATSAIAEATARCFAASGARFYLIGRNAEKLAAIARDLEIRSGQPVHHESLDLDRLDQHPPLLERAEQALGGIDIALIAHGTLPDQVACQQSVAMALAAIHTNGLGVISLATLLANTFEARGQGALIAIGSVAGDRGGRAIMSTAPPRAWSGCFCKGCATG